MENENENEEIENAEFDGGVVRMSAQGMTYESNEDNEIETAEYAWKVNRAGLYQRLAEQINEKLNLAIQGMEYEGMVDPLVLYFSCHEIARHFYDELESRGWYVTIDQDNDVIQVDIVSSIDQMCKDVEVINKAHYFSQDDLASLE
ncbi:hypothetical protein LH991_14115 [Schleiferilactobacillus harbinensis]|uniref:hypothetical protein n=1 Tax=Schleiferilactobacillus harbinensis TaxID=304207 RepID=UPI000486667A|nr:hypothetical protein [Schleiferilactobacillus harbinensis]QFR64999.1 hypothetical protein LH991_14115 [Schleiferilactobacillus harbinensis]